MRVPVLRGVMIASLIAGCGIVGAPDKIEALDKRVAELEAIVKPEPKAKPKAKGAKAAKGEKAEKGEKADAEEPAADDAEAPKDEHADAEAEPEADADAPEADAEKPAPKPKAKAKPRAEVAEAPPGPPHVPHWSYEGDTGPATWGKLEDEWKTCGVGKAQSPIDIMPHKSNASAIEFDYHPGKATVVDNGHTLQVNVAPGSGITIDGHRYELVQFHVHTPSEHTLAGDRYALEVHLVHKDDKGKLAVIGVLFDEGTPSPVLDAVWKKWPSKQNQEKTLASKFDPSTLLPANRNVYRYEGSLTTPPCSEGVVWNVMRRTMSESPAHLALLRKHYPNNARPVVASGDREVE
ncbi:MAG: carbonic anhydrase family protein [Deltaproteobacteria bacterium]|nr:carbonic anhydrase family protein [Deltaproteobacteria bacterium]